MGREINRVPLDFDWPIGQTWLGYSVSVDFPPCPDCKELDSERCSVCCYVYRGHSTGCSDAAMAIKADLRSGARQRPEGVGEWDDWRAVTTICEQEGIEDTCSRCKGKGYLATPELEAWAESKPETPIPTGDGWQLWETVADSPMSPVFATPDELVDWMTTNPWMMNPQMFSRELLVPSDRQTAERFVAAGWAPSLMSGPGIGVVDGVTFVTQERGEDV